MDSELTQIIESARALGIEMDAATAAEWVQAVEIAASSADITLDHRAGVFGHRVSMLDFSSADLAYFRSVGALVEIPDEPGVETALALSGSAAQSKIQTFPGDCDYFERVNIVAPTREAACARLGEVLRKKALATKVGDTYWFMEAKFGSYSSDVHRGGALQRSGSPISWTIEEIETGAIEVVSLEGDHQSIRWEEAALDPGWCKLDWVVADPVRRKVASASNMLDVTWESPEGAIVPLDGYLDPYFQEIYLDAAEIPLFSKVAKHVSADALDTYVAALEAEVTKYLDAEHCNYGKAAKRMYNIFRLDGRYHLAAFLRELFDEPTTVLYQVYSVVRTLEEASDPGSPITVDTVLNQLDELMMSVVREVEGEAEQEIVRELLGLRDSISRNRDLERRPQAVEASRAELLNLVNNFFYEKMTGLPEVKAYVDGLGDPTA